MSALPKKKRLTEDEYLVIERDAKFKSEFYNGEMFAMAGASRSHNELQINLTSELHSRLKGGSCRVFGSDMRVKVKRTGLYTYTDAVIACDPECEKRLGVETLVNTRSSSKFSRKRPRDTIAVQSSSTFSGWPPCRSTCW